MQLADMVVLVEDLESVDRSRTPWLMVNFHAPFYNSNVKHQRETERVELYEPSTGNVKWRLRRKGWGWFAEFTPDGGTICVGGDFDTLSLVDAATGVVVDLVFDDFWVGADAPRQRESPSEAAASAFDQVTRAPGRAAASLGRAAQAHAPPRPNMEGPRAPPRLPPRGPPRPRPPTGPGLPPPRPGAPSPSRPARTSC